MPRTVSWSAESPFGCEQFHSALRDEDYWLARLGQYDVGTDIPDSPIVEGDGTVTVATTLSVFGDRLPKMVTQLRRGDVKMVRHEKWTPVEGGPVRGQTSTTAPGVPLSVLTEALLTPARDGSRLEYTTTVEIRVPFIGGKIESHIGSKVPEHIAETHRFTMAWINGNA
ncbi:MAG TPA: DUF2505 domain-containing protein [Mycobacterium sp.]|uniref:DUF2505 domain-containing protein n=1 Tax=Mycobacterium sp. TaxID=1785 RepID=UPI002CA8CF77|nr:DUF2505 domain-containing protein [Mycobacterium sp.]HME77121.1 DUF2505 domain-containing protein [Mycobacterium sp.]